MPRKRGQLYTFDRNDPNLPLVTDTSPDDVPITFSNYGLRNNLIALPQFGVDTSRLIDNALLQLEDNYTLPLRYKISNGENAFRQMTLPHPSSQMRVCKIYSEYSELITYYCGKSSFSLRYPAKISSSFYRKNPLADLKKYRDSGVTELAKDGMYKHPSAYFVYGGIDKYYKYFQSDEFYEWRRSSPRCCE
ncbi:MAG: hypothetical protein EOP09_04155 [Proteobacteria bacterium]|nr:MAG: hypothetical protein EOP09_04155 [Pseudomonadota bacterium]